MQVRWKSLRCIHREFFTNQLLKEFRKSVHICQSYYQTSSGLLFETQCTQVKRHRIVRKLVILTTAVSYILITHKIIRTHKRQLKNLKHEIISFLKVRRTCFHSSKRVYSQGRRNVYGTFTHTLRCAALRCDSAALRCAIAALSLREN